MSLFREEHSKRFEEKKEKQAKISKQIQNQKEIIKNLPGKYLTQTFGSQTWSKSDREAQTIIYQQIVDFANTYDLKIINIGRMEEGVATGVGIPVIFEKSY